MSRFDERLADRVGTVVVRWISLRVDPSRRDWVEAFSADAAACDGWRRMRWALGGLPLVWEFRKRPRHVREDTMLSPRMVLTAIARRSADYAAVGVTLSLMGLYFGLAVFLMPVYFAVMQAADVPVPWPARVAMDAFAGPEFLSGLLIALLLLLLLHVRRPTEPLRLRPLLLTVNIVCILGIGAMGTAVVQFTDHLGTFFTIARRNALAEDARHRALPVCDQNIHRNCRARDR